MTRVCWRVRVWFWPLLINVALMMIRDLLLTLRLAGIERDRSSRGESSRAESLRAMSSRDHVGGALCSATVPRPSASSLMSLRRARHRPDPASTPRHPGFSRHSRPARHSRHSREGGNPVSSHTHHARCLGAWGEWRSGIKEEPEGRGTAAEPLTPSAEAYTNPASIHLLANTNTSIT